MKKLLSILAIAGVMTACNSGETKGTAGDSAIGAPADSVKTETPATTPSTDSAKKATDSAAAKLSADSTKK